MVRVRLESGSALALGLGLGLGLGSGHAYLGRGLRTRILAHGRWRQSKRSQGAGIDQAMLCELICELI